MSFLWQRLCLRSPEIKQLKYFVRNLNLLEYQSKNLLREHGVAIQNFCLLDKEDKSQLKNFGKLWVTAIALSGKGIAIWKNVDEYVIKAQILAGGRGKGHFNNGFKGGVHFTKEKKGIEEITNKMLGYNLITKQTPKDGIPVKKVMIAESVNITRETYLCIAMDRSHNGPVIIASPAGGVDIEAVAEKTPNLIKNTAIDIFEGIDEKKAGEIADFLEFKGDFREKAIREIRKLYRMFLKLDCTQLEINPLVETDKGEVISVDAKLNFDDNAKFRQKEVFDMEDVTESDPREVEAATYNLNYIQMTGNIGCLVNGAGLAMATMDIIKLHGGDPANFLDVGGSVKEEQVAAAFKIITEDANVKSVLVNVFGGIVNCAIIANGIVNAMKSIKLKIPLIVRLEGTNAPEARNIIRRSGLNIQAAQDLDDAAKKAVKSI